MNASEYAQWFAAFAQCTDGRDFFGQRGRQIELMILLFLDDLTDLFGHREFTERFALANSFRMEPNRVDEQHAIIVREHHDVATVADVELGLRLMSPESSALAWGRSNSLATL